MEATPVGEEVMMLALLEDGANEVVGVRMPKDLKKSVQEAAKHSGWSVSEQIRYELSAPRGLWKPIVPYLPQPTAAKKH